VHSNKAEIPTGAGPVHRGGVPSSGTLAHCGASESSTLSGETQAYRLPGSPVYTPQAVSSDHVAMGPPAATVSVRRRAPVHSASRRALFEARRMGSVVTPPAGVSAKSLVHYRQEVAGLLAARGAAPPYLPLSPWSEFEWCDDAIGIMRRRVASPPSRTPRRS
jgi:hypothetical protein